jgi:hypothetical protein
MRAGTLRLRSLAIESARHRRLGAAQPKDQATVRSSAPSGCIWRDLPHRIIDEFEEMGVAANRLTGLVRRYSAT